MTTSASREQGLENLLCFYQKSLPETLKNIHHRRNNVRLGAVLCQLARHAHVKAMHAYFVEHDVDQCKQNFYLATRLTLESVGQDGGASFEVGGDIQIALLSDSPVIIDVIARVEIPELISQRNDPLASRFYVYMLQLAIRGEDDAVRVMIEKVAKHGKKPWRTECAEGRDFFHSSLSVTKLGSKIVSGRSVRV
ncbi:hypothetical protein [Paraburkholderia flava]|uniref:hypothetical protein n=1 Tax=Paraburkholderia flava TaxID=2547393 RepID=UPI0010616A9A|nr:hypothetical protein [Paraburkholderia flava]